MKAQQPIPSDAPQPTAQLQRHGPSRKSSLGLARFATRALAVAFLLPVTNGSPQGGAFIEQQLMPVARGALVAETLDQRIHVIGGDATWGGGAGVGIRPLFLPGRAGFTPLGDRPKAGGERAFGRARARTAEERPRVGGRRRWW